MKNNNFIAVAVNDLLTYYTPKEIIEYVEKHKNDYVIINPPFKTKNYDGN